MPWSRSLVLPVIVAASTVAHAGFFVAMRGEPRTTRTAPSFVEIAVTPPPPAAPPAPVEPPVETPAPAPTRPVPAPRVARRAPPPPPPAETAPSPPPRAESAPPVDFTGTTLTNDSGTGWVSATGDGSAMDAPVRSPVTTSRPRVAPIATRPAATERPVVALDNLSRRPRAPALDDALARHYPATARHQGVAGKAVVKARIGADGKARVLAIVSESADGFGRACRLTLDGSRWDPPLDQHGRAVDTILSYTCRFEVGA